MDVLSPEMLSIRRLPEVPWKQEKKPMHVIVDAARCRAYHGVPRVEHDLKICFMSPRGEGFRNCLFFWNDERWGKGLGLAPFLSGDLAARGPRGLSVERMSRRLSHRAESRSFNNKGQAMSWKKRRGYHGGKDHLCADRSTVSTGQAAPKKCIMAISIGSRRRMALCLFMIP